MRSALCQSETIAPIMTDVGRTLCSFASRNTSTDGSHLVSLGPSQKTGVSGATQGTHTGSFCGRIYRPRPWRAVDGHQRELDYEAPARVRRLGAVWM